MLPVERDYVEEWEWMFSVSRNYWCVTYLSFSMFSDEAFCMTTLSATSMWSWSPQHFPTSLCFSWCDLVGQHLIKLHFLSLCFCIIVQLPSKGNLWAVYQSCEFNNIKAMLLCCRCNEMYWHFYEQNFLSMSV